MRKNNESNFSLLGLVLGHAQGDGPVGASLRGRPSLQAYFDYQ
jgi:hypothetical protein